METEPCPCFWENRLFGLVFLCVTESLSLPSITYSAKFNLPSATFLYVSISANDCSPISTRSVSIDIVPLTLFTRLVAKKNESNSVQERRLKSHHICLSVHLKPIVLLAVPQSSRVRIGCDVKIHHPTPCTRWEPVLFSRLLPGFSAVYWQPWSLYRTPIGYLDDVSLKLKCRPWASATLSPKIHFKAHGVISAVSRCLQCWRRFNGTVNCNSEASFLISSLNGFISSELIG